MTEPLNKNFLSPLGYSFNIHKIPHVNFFVTRVNVPGVQMTPVEIPTPFNRVPITGDKMSFNELTVTFKVDEDLKNYREIFDWMNGMAFPEKYQQYKELHDKGMFTGNGIYSDATVSILTSSMNPNIDVAFIDAFPVALTDLEFASTGADVEYVEATVSFRYRSFSINAIIK